MGRLVVLQSGGSLPPDAGAADVTPGTLGEHCVHLAFASTGAGRARWRDRLRQAVTSLAVLDSSAAVLAATLEDGNRWFGSAVSEGDESDR
jgi:hypothetical protein